MSAPSEMRVLLTAIRKNGYKVVRTGNGAHQKVLDKSGAVVTDANGPLIISGSPSEHRWREMHVHRLMAAKVLTADPWKPTGKNGASPDDDEAAAGRNGKTPQQLEEEERRRLANQERSDGLRGRTNVLRSRLEPIVAKLGGWSMGNAGVSQDDFARVMLHWVKTRGKQELMPQPATATAVIPGQPEARRAVSNLRTPGATLSLKWHPVFEGFVDELEEESGDPPDPTESSLKYLELLRETKGITQPPVQPGAPVQAGDRIEPYHRVRQPPDALEGDVVLTPFAQDVLWLMARGAGDGDRDRVLQLAARVSELDMNNERKERDSDDS